MTASGKKLIAKTNSELSPQLVGNSTGSGNSVSATADSLFESISQLIQESHARVSVAVNAEMTELYWQVGRVLNEDVMGGERQAYGSQTLEGLSKRLTSEYGRGWSAHHLRQCMRLATTFPDEEILYAVRTKLNWTCIRTIMYIDGRDYYIDLLFFHRRLRRLVAIELKLGDFEASFKGQMELYLRWLEKTANLHAL